MVNRGRRRGGDAEDMAGRPSYARGVRVHLGPVPTEGATAWIRYARQAVAEKAAAPDSDPLPADALAGFVRFLDEWEAVAAHSTTFLWEADVDPDTVEYLALALYRFASELDEAARRRGFDLMPDEAMPFYRAVVTAFLDAMATESEAIAAYAEDLRTDWPRLHDQT
jgi:hypothetical protein